MNKLTHKKCCLEIVGLGLIGAYCFLSAVFGANFAKIHLSFSFIKIPLFIGEALLLVCAGILVVLMINKRVLLTKEQYFFLGYLLVIVLWGGVDYFHYNNSALAFRNSLLFFYPVFSLFTYSFYRRAFLKLWVKISLLSLLFIFGLYVKTYYSFVFLILGILLLTGLKKPWNYILGFGFLALWPYKEFLSEQRTWLVSSSVVILFFIYVILRYFLNLRKSYRWVGGVVLSLILIAGIWYFADKGGLRSLVCPQEVIEFYREEKKIIKEKKSTHVAEHLDVGLYHNQKDNKEISLKISPKKELQITYYPLSILSDQAAQSKVEVSPEDVVSSHFKRKSDGRNIQTAYVNIVFRLLIWEDMMGELWQKKAVLGVGMGEPQRSRSIEILGWADGEWERDGWIAPHNSFLHLIYRAGIIGVGIIVVIFMLLQSLIRGFIDRRSMVGILLSGIIIYGLVAANFLLILELPYYAIPFWSLLGLTLAYRRDLLLKERVIIHDDGR
ncbi:MAG: hypothetical protein HQL15_03150 [Candidatus Omnitrophica bacterium]|nr:hypothetical protein [Candidatus Omnitrophota bacterium]